MFTSGSHHESVMSLQSFGIPANLLLPMRDDAETTTGVYREMLEKQRKRERMVHTIGNVGVPGRNDVIFGRGKKYHQHLGNIRYRGLVEDCKEKYDNASRDEKKRITEEIVGIVKETTGRFLKDDGAGWVEVADDVARLKVSSAFRAMRINTNSTTMTTTKGEAPTLKRMSRD